MPHSTLENIGLGSNKLACRSRVKEILTGKGDTLSKLSESSTTGVRVSFPIRVRGAIERYMMYSISERRVTICSFEFACCAACQKRTSTRPAMNQQNCQNTTISVIWK